MALDFAKTETKKITIRVFYGDEELEFYAEAPTTEERLQYRRELAKLFDRRGRLDHEKLTRLQCRWAKRKLVGFREGDLMENGQPLNPSESRWKEMLEEKAPEILTAICDRLFEAPEAEAVSGK